MSELENDLMKVPTEEGKGAAEEALAAIRSRSFSGRNPDLGKMVTCGICRRRTRSSEVHSHPFAKRWIVTDDGKVYTEEELIAGVTPETETVLQSRKMRAFFGAAMFAKKRRNPPLNWRQNQYVEWVRRFTPDEYTPEQLQKAREIARGIVVRMHGRHGYMKPLWLEKKEAREKAAKEATEAK